VESGAPLPTFIEPQTALVCPPSAWHTYVNEGAATSSSRRPGDLGRRFADELGPAAWRGSWPSSKSFAPSSSLDAGPIVALSRSATGRRLQQPDPSATRRNGPRSPGWSAARPWPPTRGWERPPGARRTRTNSRPPSPPGRGAWRRRRRSDPAGCGRPRACRRRLGGLLPRPADRRPRLPSSPSPNPGAAWRSWKPRAFASLRPRPAGPLGPAHRPRHRRDPPRLRRLPRGEDQCARRDRGAALTEAGTNL